MYKTIYKYGKFTIIVSYFFFFYIFLSFDIFSKFIKFEAFCIFVAMRFNITNALHYNIIVILDCNISKGHFNVAASSNVTEIFCNFYAILQYFNVKSTQCFCNLSVLHGS